ncbi:MAG TPA: hypothetical protein PLI41_06765 [Bacteroidales bacterium]|nr:hypothetical protein [Bacteroidales bacterium]
MTQNEHKQTKEVIEGRINPEHHMSDRFIDNTHTTTFRPIRQTGNDRDHDCGNIDWPLLFSSSQEK